MWRKTFKNLVNKAQKWAKSNKFGRKKHSITQCNKNFKYKKFGSVCKTFICIVKYWLCSILCVWKSVNLLHVNDLSRNLEYLYAIRPEYNKIPSKSSVKHQHWHKSINIDWKIATLT